MEPLLYVEQPVLLFNCYLLKSMGLSPSLCSNAEVRSGLLGRRSAASYIPTLTSYPVFKPPPLLRTTLRMVTVLTGKTFWSVRAFDKGRGGKIARMRMEPQGVFLTFTSKAALNMYAASALFTLPKRVSRVYKVDRLTDYTS